MPHQDPNAQLIRGNLQNISMMFKNPDEDFVADKVFPTIDGISRKARVPKYNKGPWFRDDARPRARGAAGVESRFGFNYVNLDPVNYNHTYIIPKEDLEDERDDLSFADSVQDALELNATKLDIAFERQAANILHTADWSGKGAGGVDAEGGWGNATATSDTFLADMATGRSTIRAATGIVPNKLFLDYEAYQALMYAPALTNLVYPTGFKGDVFVSPENLARLAMVDEVVIGKAVYNTDPESYADADADVTNVSIWARAAEPTKGVGFLYYAPSRPGRKTPSAGYSYKLRKLENNQTRVSTRWYDNDIKSWKVDTEEERDTVAVDLDLGFLWYDTALT